jgi:aspartokinase/homoserine dehydrogenase 1
MISVLSFREVGPQTPERLLRIADIIEQAFNQTGSPHCTASTCAHTPRRLVVVISFAQECTGIAPGVKSQNQMSELVSLLSGRGLTVEHLPNAETAHVPTTQVVIVPTFARDTHETRISPDNGASTEQTAARIAVGLNAASLEIWTDMEGLHTCDPTVVPDAIPLTETSYNEAMELAFFGTKVLHPTALLPALEARIPTAIRNTQRPEAVGTWIHADATPSPGIIRGITSLSDIVMFNLTGAGMKGVPGIASRAFSALSRESISIIFITQASSEYSIGFCLTREEAQRANTVLRAEFHEELRTNRIEPVELIEQVAILSIVGDKMREKRGVAATFFRALASIDVNIVSIAQGPSERNISVVILERDRVRALKKCHEFFFNSAQRIQLFLVGIGGVGGRLLEQISRQRERLGRQNVELSVCGIANSRGILLSDAGIDLESDWKKELQAAPPFVLDRLIEHVRRHHPVNPVFVDCTSDPCIARCYPDLFRAGLHVVTPNKKANTMEMDYYRELRRVADDRKRRFLYETNVGAGLPVIDSLKNLMKSGDTLVEFQGILSGSLSFLFGLIEEGVPFSQAVLKAKELGFTEPDPRDDLCGVDVARKLLILARETGRPLELSDIEIESVLPNHIPLPDGLPEFLSSLSRLDEWFQSQVAVARDEGSVLRFVGQITANGCSVGIRRIPRHHPLAAIRGGENALSFLSQRYKPTPLVIRGYGAGADVTAAGVFADVLKTVFWNMDVI